MARSLTYVIVTLANTTDIPVITAPAGKLTEMSFVTPVALLSVTTNEPVEE